MVEDKVFRWLWKAEIEIIVREGEEIKEVHKFPNKIVMVGRKLWRDMLKGDVSDGKIKKMALGDNPTVVTDSDIKLWNETFRKSITTSSTPTDDKYKTVVYITAGEAVGIINEIGWFAGVLAGDTKDSGVMIARVLWYRDKTNLESLEISRTDTISEVI